MSTTTIAICVALFVVMAARRLVGAGRGARRRRSHRHAHFGRIVSSCKRRRGAAHDHVDWAETLEQVAAELRTGSSLTRAVAGCLPAGLVQRGIDSGDTLAASLARLDPGAGGARRDRDDAGDRRLAMGTLIAVARVGGSGGAAIERTADTIRERRDAVAERHAQAAQARLSAVVLSSLPPVFALWSVSTDARVRTFLLGSTLGVASVVAGALLNVMGWWWMRRLTGARR